MELKERLIIRFSMFTKSKARVVNVQPLDKVNPVNLLHQAVKEMDDGDDSGFCCADCGDDCHALYVEEG